MEISRKNFFYFLVLNLLVWSLIPLLRSSLPMDTQEALIWGRDYFLGTPKHPPFSGWLAWPFYTVFLKFDGAMYLLSQICIALGILYIYRLAKLFLDEQKAILATMLQFGIIYYNFSTPEYNVNVVSIALWPMCTFYFFKALQKNKWSDWLICAILASLNILNKYTGGILLFAFALYILSEKSARKILFNPKAYIAAFLAVWIITPHAYWLHETNFVSFDYIFNRSSGGDYSGALLGHILYPLKFMGAQILFTAAAWLSYFIFYAKAEKEEAQTDISKTKFLLIVGLVPFLIFVLIGIINGSALKSMWGFPLWFLMGISLMYFFPCHLNEKKSKILFCTMAGWSMLFATAYGLQCLLTTSPRFHLNNRATVQAILQEWHKVTGSAEPKYIAADVWYADMFALYGHDIKTFYWFDLEKNPDIKKKVLRKEILVVANDEYEYSTYLKKYGDKLSSPHKMPIEISNYFGKVKQKELYYGFYNIKEAKK